MEEAKKLTEVNADCLEQIFKRLRLVDLVNVAESNKELKPGADLVFRSRYGKQSIEIDSEYKVINIYNANGRHTAKIRWSLRFKLLRCFGHLMKKLRIAYVRSHEPSEMESKQAASIDRYVNQYCADTLLEIKFEHCEKRTLTELRKPFSSVKSVHFNSCQLGGMWPKLNKWFPQVQYLEFSCENGLSTKIREAAHFNDLRNLNIFIPSNRKKHFANLLQSNRKLQSLSISGYFNAKHLQRVSEHLQHLKLHPFRVISNKGNAIIRCPNVTELTLQNVAPERFPFTFGQVKELSITPITDNFKYVDLITTNKATLTKLTYWGSKLGEQGSLLKIASSLLIDVNLFYCRFHIDEVVAFMGICTALKKFTLGFDIENDYKIVLKRSGGSWHKTNIKSINRVKIVTFER